MNGEQFRYGVDAAKLADGSVLVMGAAAPGSAVMVYDPAIGQFRPTDGVNVLRLAAVGGLDGFLKDRDRLFVHGG